jgi:hypothetical protein
MSLLDGTETNPPSKAARYGITIGVAIVLGPLFFYWLWFLYLHMPERRATENFLNALSSGNLQQAYTIWKPDPQHYSYKDFLEDWGDQGFYGPVKSYRLNSANAPARSGSGIIVRVEVNPFSPFPDGSDLAKSRRTKEVRLWVESKDKSLSFAP